MANWFISSNQLGLPPIEDTNTTQLAPLGTICKARSETYGEGEFIYLLGVASTVVGSLVSYNALTGATTLSPASGYNTSHPVAVAMSANVASQYGWYQIAGAAVVKKPAVKAQPTSNVYLSGTAGRVRTSAYSGRQILGAKVQGTTTITTTTSTVVVTLDRPHVQGAVA